MPLVSFIIAALVLLFIGSGWVLSCVWSVTAWRRKWPVLKWVFATLLVGFSLIVAAALYGVYRSSSPNLVFEDTFHRKPPSETKVLHGKSSGFADSAGIELVFRTDRATFDVLRPESMELEKNGKYLRTTFIGRTWWRNPTSATEIWVKDHTYGAASGRTVPEQNFGSELTIMTWDADGLVQYFWIGVD